MKRASPTFGCCYRREFDQHVRTLVEDWLIVELKACKATTDERIAQLLGYLKSSRVETGLLINFGGAKLHVKKYLMTP